MHLSDCQIVTNVWHLSGISRITQNLRWVRVGKRKWNWRWNKSEQWPDDHNADRMRVEELHRISQSAQFTSPTLCAGICAYMCAPICVGANAKVSVCVCDRVYLLSSHLIQSKRWQLNSHVVEHKDGEGHEGLIHNSALAWILSLSLHFGLGYPWISRIMPY